MKAFILYGSTLGSSKRVAEAISREIRCVSTICNARDVIIDGVNISEFDLFIFVASTWGDGELQIDMEGFLVRWKHIFNLQQFVVCELGNYYGYDDFEFGALNIMREELLSVGGLEMFEPLCFDSIPKKDWDTLKRWCLALNNRISLINEYR